MGLMLSVLVMCVGVLEAISAVRHIRESYLPLEFKRKKRRMVMDVGTGTVRHVDISWPGDVPRGSHVIRRRSGMQSPHSSFDLPDEDLPRRTSIHFDPVQLERAMSEILVEEEPSNETSEETSISSTIVRTRLEFPTRHSTESAAVPFNELRQETEQLPGNRPSLPSLREADIADPKTPVPRTNRPPSDPITKNDSVTFSEKISRDIVITSTKEFSPENELILKDFTVSPLPTEIPKSPHESHQLYESGSSTTQPALVITTSETQFHQPVECENANQEGTHVQDSPLISPVISETEGSITSVTEISGSISTNILILDESTDKSEEDIPIDQPNRPTVDRLGSIEELIKSTNNIIIRQDSKLDASFSSRDQNVAGVIERTKFVEDDSVGSKTDTESLLEGPNDPNVDTKSDPSSRIEADIPSVLNESDDSENSVRSVVQPSAKETKNEQKFSDNPKALHQTVLPEAVPETRLFQKDEGKSILPGSCTHEQGIAELPADQAASSTNLVSDLERPCHKEDAPLERGLSHESTISLESVEESSSTSLESQGLPSLPALKEKRGESEKNGLNGYARSDVELQASEFDPEDSHELIKEPDTVSLQRHLDLAQADSQYSETKVSSQTDSENENDELSIDTVRVSRDSVSGPSECCTVSVASSIGDNDLGTKQVSSDEVTEHVVLMSESQKGYQKNDDTNLDVRSGMKGDSAWPKTDEAQDHSKDDVEQRTTLTKAHRIENVEEGSAGQSVQVEESYVPKSCIAKVPPHVDVAETHLDDTRNMLDREKNNMAKRKSVIETESIVISTHQIENDENVSAQRANQSNETQSATMVNCEDACTLQDSTISLVSGKISQSSSNDEPPATGADFEDVAEDDTKLESDSDANGKSVAGQSSQLGGLEPPSKSEMVWENEKNDTVKRKSLVETESVVISTHKIENDEHISPQRAYQSNETQSATMVDCEPSFTLQDNVIPSGFSQISQLSSKSEEAAVVGADFGDVTVNAKIDNCSQAIIEIGQLASTSESEVSKPWQSHDDNSKARQEGDTTAQIAQDRAKTDDLRIREDGQNESNSNEIPTTTDQSNASEVKQETKSVSGIEESEGEVDMVAPTTPKEPEMEDIQVPTADTSPNKAFWVRD